jgi:hypothetical protein
MMAGLGIGRGIECHFIRPVGEVGNQAQIQEEIVSF